LQGQRGRLESCQQRLEEEAEEDEVVVKQAVLGTVPELVFHQLVIRVDRTLNPISVFPDHVYSSGLSTGPFTCESLVNEGGEMAGDLLGRDKISSQVKVSPRLTLV
jgi:hypothetical protein